MSRRRKYGRTCSVFGCGRPHTARGLCQKHYAAMQRYGDPTEVRAKAKSQR